MPRCTAIAVLLFPVALVAQAPDLDKDQAAITWAQSINVGDRDGRWLCYSLSADLMTVLFLDPTTIKFDKKLGAWTCWCRVIETKDRFEWKVQTAFRNEGQEEATIGFAKYKFPGGIFISQSTRTAKEMQWEQTIPDTSVEALWKIIKAHIVAHSTPKKK